MFDASDQPTPPDTPYDDRGRVDVPGAPGWRYVAIDGDRGDSLTVQMAGPDDVRIAFAVPDFVARGDELGEVARIVIRAWERKERSEGLGA